MGKKIVFLIFVSKIDDPCQPHAPAWQEPFAPFPTAAVFCVFSWNLSPWQLGITEVSGNFTDFATLLQRFPAEAA